MQVLVDANIVIGFIDGDGYARRFFAQAMREQWELFFIPDVYNESPRVTTAPDALKWLFSELVKHEAYRRIYPTALEEQLAMELSGRCISLFGYNIAGTDRRLAAVAKSRGLPLFTKDKDLQALAAREGVRLFRHIP